MKSHTTFFRSSFAFLVLGLIAAVFVGAWDQSATGVALTSPAALRAGLSAGFIALVLAALEISLSFDNAIVNASVLRNMTPVWRQRFLTWGMLIAVFLMRLVFPIAIVSIIAHLNPWSALKMALFDPPRYARVMHDAHLAVSVFGGTFLTLVATHFFCNDERQGIWLRWIEQPLARLGRFKYIYVLFTSLLVIGFASQVNQEQLKTFLITAAAAVLTYLAIHSLSEKLAQPVTEGESDSNAAPSPDSKFLDRASAAMFIYLEILDASFSFDGVVGAFAITNHLLIITIGLSIGAMFVRSLTLMLVEKQALTDYIYLEAGAFHAIAILGLLMFVSIFFEVPETITGLSGLLVIGLAWYASHRHNQRRPGPAGLARRSGA